MQNIAGWPGKQLYGAVGTLYCSIYAAAHWTDLRSHTGTGSQAQSTAERNAAGRQQGNQPLAMSAVPASCVSAWSLLRTLAYGMHSRRKRMFERCAGNTAITCKKETRRACGAGLSVSEELAMLGSHSQLAETQCMITAAAVICNLLAQQHAHACFGVLVRSDLHCAACTWLNLSVAQTQCMQQ
jgi:hypothetical protein